MEIVMYRGRTHTSLLTGYFEILADVFPPYHSFLHSSGISENTWGFHVRNARQNLIEAQAEF